MTKYAVTSLFSRAAATTVLALGLSMTPQESLAQSKPSTGQHDNPSLDTARGIKNIAVVTWGDSIGNGVGLNLGRTFNKLVNLGRDGAGLTNAIPAQPLEMLPKGAAVLMSIGTNDVENLMKSPQADIDAYARRVIGIALHVRKQGAIPIIIGMQAPPAPYTGGVPGGNSKWNKQGFLESWTANMHRMNKAIELAAKNSGVAYSVVQDRVPERHSDNLHYTPRGSRHIAENALKDAGIRF